MKIRPKIAYFNCTGVTPHIGCLGVTDAHFRMLLTAGYDVPYVYSISETRSLWKGNREETLQAIEENETLMAHLAECAAVVINGEGTTHHNRGGDLLTIALKAKSLSKPVMLVNCIMQEMELWFDVLEMLDDINVREQRSHDYLNAHNIKNRLVLDSFLEAKFCDEVTQDFSGKTLVTDWHPVRDSDVGEAITAYKNSHLDDVHPFPFQHESHYVGDAWRHQIANISTADLIITGRHHGMYAAIMAGIPFVVLPSNSFKIEGMVEYCPMEIPFCDNFRDLEKQKKIALANPNLFLELRDFVRSHMPLSTFEVLKKIVPAIARKDMHEVNEKTFMLLRDLQQKAVKKERLKSAAVVEKLTQANTKLKNKVNEFKEKSLVSKENNAIKFAANKEKIIQLTTNNRALQQQVKTPSSVVVRDKRLDEELKKHVIALANLSLKAKEYNNGYRYAKRALELDPLNVVMVTVLFKCEANVSRDVKCKNMFGKAYIKRTLKLPETVKRFAVLAHAYAFGSGYNQAIKCYRQLEILQSLNEKQLESLANCFHAVGDYEEAENIYLDRIDSYSTTNVAQAIAQGKKLITVYNQAGEFDKALALVKRLESTLLPPEKKIRQVYVAHLGKRDLHKAWPIYSSYFDGIYDHKPFCSGVEVFVQRVKTNTHIDSMVVVPCGGVGDEIRHSYLYNDLRALQPSVVGTVHVACDARVQTLFERSFMNITFIPVSRTYIQNPPELKVNTPKKLHELFSDDIYEVAKKADMVVHCFSLMSVFRDTYQAFEDSKQIALVARDDLRQKWKKKLASMGGNLKVGINKGSHLLASVREPNMFPYLLWQPLFDLESIDFINLSFDVEADEIDSLKQIMGTENIFHLGADEIDLRDDMENMAALFSELDVIVTPPNMMVDFAGALGAYTLCLHTTGEYDWRFVGDDLKDVWHKNVHGVRSDAYGKKDGIMYKAAQKLCAIRDVKK